MIKYTDAGATFSSCRRYRYRLWRDWNAGHEDRTLLTIGLNPSKAGEHLDDPTIRREVSLAVRLGCTRLEKFNMFAYRATKPTDLAAFIRAGGNPMGPLKRNANDGFLEHHMDSAVHPDVEWKLACWGASKLVQKYVDAECIAWREFKKGDLYALRLNADGSPAHPLYLPGDLEPRLVSELRGMAAGDT